MYWYLNKETNTAKIYGGITAMIKVEKMDKVYKSRFEETFSRKKLIKYEDPVYRIEKCEVITSPRK